MLIKTLLLGAFFLVCTATIAQDRASIESQISEKEYEFENAKASSRQVNEDIKLELIELYGALKNQLESEIEATSNLEIKAIKNQEISVLNDKIASYSQKK